jgi:hypothetical protein
VFEASDFEYVEFERLYGKATVYLNDVEIGNNLKGSSKNNRPYRFYCSFNEWRKFNYYTKSTYLFLSTAYSNPIYYNRIKIFAVCSI